jgi:ribosome biogenesis GTPase A
MTPSERYKKLKEYLSSENPVLLDAIDHYETVDKIARNIGLLAEDETYTTHISWWPMISILGTFSAGKSTFLNDYVGQKVQQSGNQAVDDKFTVVCYAENDGVTTLPGLALDADPRFPFYNISEEVKKVDAGDGNRVDLYLQLKSVKAEVLKGKILIDSPGFDADSQRDAILRITSHIVEMSDLVLVFFDARHPEPGAMRDTLKHLVATTINHRDANKVLYVLNQIDTTSREDNLEEVIASWQRALAREGLISGNFYAIYSDSAMEHLNDTTLMNRLRSKRDADLIRITQRMEKVSIERSYRIIKALEDIANGIKMRQLPRLQEILVGWSRKVFYSDLAVLVAIAGMLGWLEFQLGVLSPLFSTLLGSVGILGGLVTLLLFFHFKIARFFTNREVAKYQKNEPHLAHAISYNTKWWRAFLGFSRKNWQRSNIKRITETVEASRALIQKLNDQFISPSGTHPSS